MVFKINVLCPVCKKENLYMEPDWINKTNIIDLSDYPVLLCNNCNFTMIGLACHVKDDTGLTAIKEQLLGAKYKIDLNKVDKELYKKAYKLAAIEKL